MLSKVIGSLLLLVVAQMSTADDLEEASARMFQLPPRGNTVLRNRHPRILGPPRIGASPEPSGIASIFPRQVKEEVEEETPLVTGTPPAVRPLTTLQEHIDGIREDPLRHFSTMAENISSRFRQRIGTGSVAADTSPFNFLKHFEHLQKLIDDYAADESCEPIFGTIDQTIYLTKQVLQSLQALSQLKSSWLTITPDTILTCFAPPELKTTEDVS